MAPHLETHCLLPTVTSTPDYQDLSTRGSMVRMEEMLTAMMMMRTMMTMQNWLQLLMTFRDLDTSEHFINFIHLFLSSHSYYCCLDFRSFVVADQWGIMNIRTTLFFDNPFLVHFFFQRPKRLFKNDVTQIWIKIWSHLPFCHIYTGWWLRPWWLPLKEDQTITSNCF